MAPSPLASSILSFLTLSTVFLSSTHAAPHRRQAQTPTAPNFLAIYTVPLSNGTTSLSPPPTGTVLKALTLGRGTQNYTCANAEATTLPVSIGAVATLFDATPLLPFLPPLEGQVVLDLLPTYLLSFPYEALQNSSLPIKGQHFFTSAIVPVFDLLDTDVGMLVGNKTGDIAAPQGSTAGPHGVGSGAVDWLALSGESGSAGLSQGYRVFTAGGKPPKTCEGQAATIEVPYAAQYWFYG
ncbi:hypothetical protein MMC19_001198 [Ptychographa xylographoides]|nr:hypothetical protein [Ptychographa xylographoides]